MKIDRKVEKEQEKLDSLNEYKKGLLQQMFVINNKALMYNKCFIIL